MSEIGHFTLAFFFSLILAVCFGIVLRAITVQRRNAFDMDAEMARFLAGQSLKTSGSHPKK